MIGFLGQDKKNTGELAARSLGKPRPTAGMTFKRVASDKDTNVIYPSNLLILPQGEGVGLWQVSMRVPDNPSLVYLFKLEGAGAGSWTQVPVVTTGEERGLIGGFLVVDRYMGNVVQAMTARPTIDREVPSPYLAEAGLEGAVQSINNFNPAPTTDPDKFFTEGLIDFLTAFNLARTSLDEATISYDIGLLGINAMTGISNSGLGIMNFCSSMFTALKSYAASRSPESAVLIQNLYSDFQSRIGYITAQYKIANLYTTNEFYYQMTYSMQAEEYFGEFASVLQGALDDPSIDPSKYMKNPTPENKEKLQQVTGLLMKMSGVSENLRDSVIEQVEPEMASEAGRWSDFEYAQGYYTQAINSNLKEIQELQVVGLSVGSGTLGSLGKGHLLKPKPPTAVKFNLKPIGDWFRATLDKIHGAPGSKQWEKNFITMQSKDILPVRNALQDFLIKTTSDIKRNLRGYNLDVMNTVNWKDQMLSIRGTIVDKITNINAAISRARNNPSEVSRLEGIRKSWVNIKNSWWLSITEEYEEIVKNIMRAGVKPVLLDNEQGLGDQINGMFNALGRLVAMSGFTKVKASFKDQYEGAAKLEIFTRPFFKRLATLVNSIGDKFGNKQYIAFFNDLLGHSNRRREEMIKIFRSDFLGQARTWQAYIRLAWRLDKALHLAWERDGGEAGVQAVPSEYSISVIGEDPVKIPWNKGAGWHGKGLRKSHSGSREYITRDEEEGGALAQYEKITGNKWTHRGVNWEDTGPDYVDVDEEAPNIIENWYNNHLSGTRGSTWTKGYIGRTARPNFLKLLKLEKIFNAWTSDAKDAQQNDQVNESTVNTSHAPTVEEFNEGFFGRIPNPRNFLPGVWDLIKKGRVFIPGLQKRNKVNANRPREEQFLNKEFQQEVWRDVINPVWQRLVRWTGASGKDEAGEVLTDYSIDINAYIKDAKLAADRTGLTKNQWGQTIRKTLVDQWNYITRQNQSWKTKFNMTEADFVDSTQYANSDQVELWTEAQKVNGLLDKLDKTYKRAQSKVSAINGGKMGAFARLLSLKDGWNANASRMLWTARVSLKLFSGYYPAFAFYKINKVSPVFGYLALPVFIGLVDFTYAPLAELILGKGNVISSTAGKISALNDKFGPTALYKFLANKGTPGFPGGDSGSTEGNGVNPWQAAVDFDYRTLIGILAVGAGFYAVTNPKKALSLLKYKGGRKAPTASGPKRGRGATIKTDNWEQKLVDARASGSASREEKAIEKLKAAKAQGQSVSVSLKRQL